MVTEDERRVSVTIADAAYDVVLAGGLAGLGAAVGAVARPGRVALVTNDRVGPLHGDAAEASLAAAGWEPRRVTIPDGEARKDLGTWSALVDALLSAGIDRRTPVVALGGGVTGDIAGFAAASVLRGVPFVQVPTTLLAMVDASVGGKVGVNTAHGKNLVGAFYQPRLVYAPLDTLGTLPDAELRCGLGEVVKHALIAGAGELDELEADAAGLLARDPAALARWVVRSVRCKAGVVAADPLEAGVRATLNLGHTLGHAVEAVEGFGQVRHGEAVAIGLIAITRFSEARGWAEPGLARHVERVCAALELPLRCSDSLDADAIVRAVAFDKKRERATLTIVVPCAPGRVELRQLPVAEVADLARYLF